MKLIPLILTVAVLTTGCSGGRVIGGFAVGMHDERGARPEVTLTNPLGDYHVGIESDSGFYLTRQHISSIPDDEDGGGMNITWVGKRWSWDFGPEKPVTGNGDYGWYDQGCR